LIPFFKEADADMLGPLEAPYMNLAKVRDEYDIGVMGNININLFTRGSKQDVITASNKLLDDTAPCGRFVFSSDNSISRAVNPENFMAMVDTCKSWQR
jgi:uroporphyrinogen-III decarboxylase